MRPYQILILTLAVASSACSSDATTAPTATSTTGTSTSATGQTLVVDSTSNNQNVVVGSTIVLRLRVLQGTLVIPNAPVTWAVTGGAGALSATSSVTDSVGVASINLRVGDTVATNTVTASLGTASVVFTATTFAGSASGLVKVSPDSQAVTAGGALPLVARVVDRFGNAVSNATVTWSASGGTLSVVSTTTSSSGNATSNFTTAAAPATYSVTATVPGQASVTFKVVGF